MLVVMRVVVFVVMRVVVLVLMQVLVVVVMLAHAIECYFDKSRNSIYSFGVICFNAAQSLSRRNRISFLHPIE